MVMQFALVDGILWVRCHSLMLTGQPASGMVACHAVSQCPSLRKTIVACEFHHEGLCLSDDVYACRIL